MTGIPLLGENDPSYHLLDVAHQLYDTNCVKYIDWVKCTKRDSELSGVKEERGWKTDANGNLKEFTTKTPDPANTSSDYLLSCALRRRGIALDIANICRYEVHNLWSEILLGELTRPPVPGFSKISVPQFHRAD